ncbi:hypothetical protein SKAU_G00303430 [Synaphobranchus kaupii]|uniref:Uncharacterized protein n=1 Tax=Synaphobranchus kaupii TaxID=118154 RepID=A0A9Q1ILD4_SYNKA|nr:hypothetical protein SKAU_G00303430 [Synaphobranchus kaupii]
MLQHASGLTPPTGVTGHAGRTRATWPCSGAQNTAPPVNDRPLPSIGSDERIKGDNGHSVPSTPLDTHRPFAMLTRLSEAVRLVRPRRRDRRLNGVSEDYASLPA